MFCAECGKRLNPDDKFCSVCGTRIPVQEGSSCYNYVPPKHNARDVVQPQAEPKDVPVQKTVRFCADCGQEMAPQDQFCMNCGRPFRGNTRPRHNSRAANTVAQPKKKTAKGKIWGIVLVVLQVLVLLGSLDELGSMQIFELLGFVTPGIIGIILLIRNHNQNKG